MKEEEFRDFINSDNGFSMKLPFSIWKTILKDVNDYCFMIEKMMDNDELNDFLVFQESYTNTDRLSLILTPYITRALIVEGFADLSLISEESRKEVGFAFVSKLITYLEEAFQGHRELNLDDPVNNTNSRDEDNQIELKDLIAQQILATSEESLTDKKGEDDLDILSQLCISKQKFYC